MIKKFIISALLAILASGIGKAEHYSLSFPSYTDNEIVPEVTGETFTVKFEQGSGEKAPYYVKGSNPSGLYILPGNKVNITSTIGADIRKIKLIYNVTKETLVPDFGTWLNGSYGWGCTWEIPADHEAVSFDVMSSADGRTSTLNGVELWCYNVSQVYSDTQLEVKNNTYVSLNTPGATSVHIEYPDGSSEIIDCTETATCNYASVMIKFPLKASEMTIKVYPICYDKSYTDLTSEITIKQLYPEHNTTDTKIGELYYKVTNGYAELQPDARYRDLTDIVIPDYVSINGSTYPVGSIGERAFQGCDFLNTIKLPAKLQLIKTNAFSGCKALQNIDIPETVTSIYYGAFYNCSSLTSIKFPDGLKYITGAYGSYVSPIEGCSALTEVILPNNAQSSGGLDTSWHSSIPSFFIGCTSLKEVSIPDNVNAIADGLFTGNSSIEKIYIGKSLASFPSSINALTSLKDLEVSPENKSLKQVGDAIYLNKGSLPSPKYLLVCMFQEPEDGVLRLIDNATGIQSGTLNGKTLKEVVYPSTLTTTGWTEQLANCKVGKLVIPQNVQSLGKAVFRFSNIDTLIIEAADTPLVMDVYDSSYQNNGVFHNSTIRNLIINRDIDNVNNYNWPKYYTKAFYKCSIGTVEINTSLNQKACGILSNAYVGTIKVGPDVTTLYAMGCYTPYSMEIYSIDDIEAPFYIDNGPLNQVGGYTFKGFRPQDLYVYPSEIERYKTTYNISSVYPLPGSASINFGENSKTVRPGDEFEINFSSHPENFKLNWTTSNPAVATVTDEGMVTAIANGVAKITAVGSDFGYTDASASMLVYVSDTAPIEPTEAFLTLKGLGNHASRHAYKAGTAATINLLPDEGWEVHSITFNGEDKSDMLVNNTFTTPKLAGENEMNIVMTQKLPTDIENNGIEDANISINCNGNEVSVFGLENTDVVSVFNVAGEMIYNGAEKTLRLPKGNIYILKARESVFKFSL